MAGARPPAVARVRERVIKTARAHDLFLPGETVVVGVSGGPDSVCLLHALHGSRRLFKIRLEVFHLDHRLREDSASDARYVERLGARLGVPVHVRTAEGAPAKGESVEDWAHRARSKALADVVRDVGASKAAIGHTRDDQAEQVLIALLRGGGLDALAGLRPAHGFLVRPLLDVTRAEVEAMNRALHLRPRVDPSNADTRFLRNAVRHDILPAIRDATDRDARETIARVAGLLRADADELHLRAYHAAADVLDEDGSGVTVDVVQLGALPRAISGRVLREALYRAGHSPTVELIDALADLAAGRSGRGRTLAGGARVRRERGYIHIPSRLPPERSDQMP